MLPKARPCIPEQDMAALLDDFAEIMRSGRLTMGPFLAQFEREFAAFIGAEYAIGMNSGTAPLEVALRYWEVEDREVIVPTNTFIASSNAVLLAGGKPVLCDIDPQTLSCSLPQIEQVLSPRTKAIVVVHIAGQIPPDMTDIRAFCTQRGLLLLEDAAHAHGASIQGEMAGSLGDAAAFSFFPTKPLTTGEGGMLSTDDENLARFARSFRTHGMADKGRALERLGSNYRMPELSAALGLRQLARLQEFTVQRNHLAAVYRQELRRLGLADMLLPTYEGHVHAFYKFPVRLPDGMDRQRVVEALRERYGIEAGSIYWPPCHLEPFYQRELGYRHGDFPVAEQVLKHIVALPIFVGLDELQIGEVCRGVGQVMSEERLHARAE